VGEFWGAAELVNPQHTVMPAEFLDKEDLKII
jgi:hypothetical protein